MPETVSQTAAVQDRAGAAYLLRPNTSAMISLALGSATTISTLMCIPDAFGIIPGVPDAFTWCVRMVGLWLSAFILWFLGFLTMLHFARFAGGGISIRVNGIKLWRFGKIITWTDIKAITVEKQPLFSVAFRLKTPARRLVIYEERRLKGRSGWFQKKPKDSSGSIKLIPHPVPSFQFSDQEFTSLFVHVCRNSLGYVPNSLDAFAFPPTNSAAKFLRITSERATVVRKILSVVIAIGLVTFLGRKASLNYFFNRGTSCFRHENYQSAKKEFDTVTRIDPTFAPGWDQLARSEFRTDDTINAEKHWHRALQMKPDLVEAKVGLSNIYMRRGEYENAEHLLDQCARLVPHNCAIYLNQAELYSKLGEKTRAKQLLEIVEREGRADADSLAKAAKIYFDLGDIDKARSLVGIALQMKPDNLFARSVFNLLPLSKKGGERQ